jgi:hypothetical protein
VLSTRKKKTFIEEYDVYHDESDISGYWHGILLVPRSSRETLLKLLQAVRAFAKHHQPISLKGLDKESGRQWKVVHCWLHAGIAALIQDLKGERYPIFTGRYGETPEFALLDRVIGARFILFRIRDSLASLSGGMSYAAKVETTYRMAFKGGLKTFAKQGDGLCIRSLHFDNHEHLGRHVDKSRLISLIGERLDGIVFHEALIVDDKSSDHRLPSSQTYDDCQLLQLTDIFVSGFRTVLGIATCNAQLQVCRPLLELSERWNRGPARMRNSKWSNGFYLREGHIKDGQWTFANLEKPISGTQRGLFSVDEI